MSSSIINHYRLVAVSGLAMFVTACAGQTSDVPSPSYTYERSDTRRTVTGLDRFQTLLRASDVEASYSWLPPEIAANPVFREQFVEQVRLQELGIVGRAKLADDEYGAPPEGTACEPLAPDEEATGPSAVLDRIAQEASQTSIVIVNESHGTPLHRAFIADVGERLADLGYATFAAETFSDFTSAELAEATEPFVRQDVGVYSSEPIFARELRRFRELGYKFVSYEDFSKRDGAATRIERIHRREEAQAENLFAKVFKTDPDAKVLIHVGYSHAREVPQIGDEADLIWMAARLKAKTGVDPLTISQTTCRGGADRVRLSALPTDETPGSFDLIVDHPLPTYEDERPTWRREIGDVPVPLPEAFADQDQDILVEAHPLGAPFDTVPIDQLLVRPGESVSLLLLEGTYIVSALSADGPLDDTYRLDVLSAPQTGR